MPHALRAIDGEDETIAELEMIVGFDDDLAGEATRVANRLHGLLTQIHPSLERVLGSRLQHPASLAASLTAVLDQRKLLAGRIRGTPGGPPSLESPDVDAGSRRQDRSPHPDRGR
jgi:hypothetical protein